MNLTDSPITRQLMYSLLSGMAIYGSGFELSHPCKIGEADIFFRNPENDSR
jgi:hypothetical protein